MPGMWMAPPCFKKKGCGVPQMWQWANETYKFGIFQIHTDE